MNHDGDYSDAGGRRRRNRREICRSFTCLSPWFVFFRWFNGGKSRRGSGSRFVGRKWENEKMEGCFDMKRNTGPVPVKGVRNRKISPCSGEDISETGKEASFNLGVGFGLIYLVRNELNKMVQLRKNMELLLQNFQTEFQNRDEDTIYVPSKSRISSSFSNNGVQETLYAEDPNSGRYLSSQDIKQPQTAFSSNRYRREKSLRMDQIEAELEAEFDHLQLHMDAEMFLNHSKQPFSEMNVEESAAEWSANTCYEEVYEQHEELSHDECYYGVPPRELERKLHELLESRQQEKIDELESALEYVIQQLQEKERQLAWWKDTARLVLKHIPAIPTLLRQVKREFEVRETGKSVVENNVTLYP